MTVKNVIVINLTKLGFSTKFSSTLFFKKLSIKLSCSNTSGKSFFSFQSRCQTYILSKRRNLLCFVFQTLFLRIPNEIAIYYVHQAVCYDKSQSVVHCRTPIALSKNHVSFLYQVELLINLHFSLACRSNVILINFFSIRLRCVSFETFVLRSFRYRLVLFDTKKKQFRTLIASKDLFGEFFRVLPVTWTTFPKEVVEDYRWTGNSVDKLIFIFGEACILWFFIWKLR